MTLGRTFLLVAAFDVALVATDLIAQDSTRPRFPPLPTYRMRLLGVFDETTGQPLEAVDIVDVLNGVVARTTTTGTVSLAFLPDGGSLVRVRKVGFEMQTMTVSISPADTTPITVILKRVTDLPTLSVTANRNRSAALRGFEERRRTAASGQFITDSLIRREEARHIGSFLRTHLLNAIVTDGRSGGVFLGPSPRCGAGGSPAVYVDGALITPLGNPAPPVNLADYPLSILAGIEYYPTTGTAPAQFSAMTRSCGVLLLWTREK